MMIPMLHTRGHRKPMGSIKQLISDMYKDLKPKLDAQERKLKEIRNQRNKRYILIIIPNSFLHAHIKKVI